MRALLRAGANSDISSRDCGTAREIAERYSHVEVVLAIDRLKCRNLLVNLCIGMHATEFPVLVMLEIYMALCAISCERGEGYLNDSVSWEIAKKVKHFLK